MSWFDSAKKAAAKAVAKNKKKKATKGAGDTGFTTPPSLMGAVGKQKLVIPYNVYSKDGAEVNRVTTKNSADPIGAMDAKAYKLGQGGAEDTFRDFLGKVWVQSSAGDPYGTLNKLRILNPDLGQGSANPALAMPCELYVAPSEYLSDDSTWPRFRQKIIINPDANWLYQKIGKQVIDEAKGNVEGAIKGALMFNGAADVGLAATLSTANETEKAISSMLVWWKTVFDFSDKEVFSPQGTQDICNIATDDPESGICAPLIKRDKYFLDHPFGIETPFNTDADMSNNMLGLKPLLADINSVYNFYVDAYENTITKKEGGKIKEAILPNMYAFISSFIPENYSDGIYKTSKKFEDLISLKQLLKGYSGDALTGVNTDAHPFMQVPAASNDYFRAWSRTLNITLDHELNILTSLAKKYTNILFPMNDIDMLKYYNNLRFMFPMYNDITFSTGVMNEFGDLFRATKLAQQFMYFYMSRMELISNASKTEPVKSYAVNITERVLDVENPAAPVVKSTMKFLDNVKIREMDLDSWLIHMNMPGFDPYSDEATSAGYDPTSGIELDEKTNIFAENAVFITKNSNEELLTVDATNSLERSILATMLYGKMRKIGKTYVRDYTKISTGRLAHSESLMYKVVKRRGKKTVQTFYFLNSSEIDVLRFIDTQVHYGKSYVYHIRVIQLVVGTKYKYQDIGFLGSAGQYHWDKYGELIPKAPTIISPGLDIMDLMYKGQSGINTSTAAEFVQNPLTAKDESTYDGKLTPADIANAGISIVTLGSKNTGILYGHSPGDASQTDDNVHLGAMGATSGLKSTSGFVKTENENINDVTWENEFKDPLVKYDEIFGLSSPGILGDNKIGNFFTTEITVEYQPTFKIVETSYATVTGKVMDKPPIFPEVEIVPYKGINNKLLINLNNQVGSYFMKPIAFHKLDYDRIQELREAQKIPDTTKPIHYRSDDPITNGGHFQIYRMDKKPQHYQDFAKHLIQTANTCMPLEVGSLGASSAALVDNIKPNKKYYYTFRVVDAHGKTSNPSPVFEIELIENSGAVYLEQKIIEVEKIDLKVPTKTMKRYLQIKPGIEQSVLDSSAMGIADAESALEYGVSGTKPIKPGLKDESVWGKKIKIRLTSRTTGKQVDLNLDFKFEEYKDDLLAAIKYGTVDTNTQTGQFEDQAKSGLEFP